jgi:hypothetical protein
MKKHTKNKLVIIKNTVAKISNPHLIKAGEITIRPRKGIVCVETSKKFIEVFASIND